MRDGPEDLARDLVQRIEQEVHRHKASSSVKPPQPSIATRSATDDGISRPVQQGKRASGHCKDHRADLPQVVIALAVTCDIVPVQVAQRSATTAGRGDSVTAYEVGTPGLMARGQLREVLHK